MRLAKTYLRQASNLLLLAMIVALASVSPATALDLHSDSNQNFCATLDARTRRVDTRLQQVQTELRHSWQQQADRLQVVANQQQKDTDNLSRVVDVQRTDNLVRIRHGATSDAERAAVAQYKAAQQQAAAVRRTAINHATDTFNASLRRYVATRQAVQAGQIEASRIHLDDALRIARGQCAAGMSGAEVRQKYVSSVRQGQQTYLSQRQRSSDAANQVQNLINNRLQAVAAANQTYNEAMAQARLRLQAAL